LAVSRGTLPVITGLLGAGAGCVIGHHEANKHARSASAPMTTRHGAKADTTMGHITITLVGGQATWG